MTGMMALQKVDSWEKKHKISKFFYQLVKAEELV